MNLHIETTVTVFFSWVCEIRGKLDFNNIEELCNFE
jgi:hypothetical protein